MDDRHELRGARARRSDHGARRSDHGQLSDAEVEALLRDVEATDLELLEPPEHTWAAIESALQTADDVQAVDDERSRDDAQAAQDDHTVQDERSNVVSFPERQRIRRRLAVGIAAVLVVAVAGVTTLLLARDDPAEVVASATLAYDPEQFDISGAQARAGAELVADDGEHSIAIVDAALPSPEAGADLEVWLIRPDASGNVVDLVSIGIIDPADPGSLSVPEGYDPDVYSVVDISIEPRDGDPSHSGRTILRGPLQDF